MGKKFSGVSQTMSRFRGWIQAGAALLTNLHLPNFLKGGLYQGAGKTVCVPGLNCYPFLCISKNVNLTGSKG